MPQDVNLASPPDNVPEDVPLPIGVYSIIQCAKYDEHDFVAVIARDRNISPSEIKRLYAARWGGVDKFLKCARDQRSISEDMRTRQRVFNPTAGPQSHHEIRTVFLHQWSINIRTWGFEDLSCVKIFALDFTDIHGQHITTPYGLTITSASHVVGQRLFSVQSALESSVAADTAQAMRESNDLGQEVYLIAEGTLLDIAFRGTTIRLQMPWHYVQNYNVPLEYVFTTLRR